MFGNLLDQPLCDLLTAMSNRRGLLQIWFGGPDRCVHVQLHLEHGYVTALTVDGQIVREEQSVERFVADLPNTTAGVYHFVPLDSRQLDRVVRVALAAPQRGGTWWPWRRPTQTGASAR